MCSSDLIALLDAADGVRPAGYGDQFGRFTGVPTPDRPGVRTLQTSAPLLSDRTGYVIPAGPYRDDARRTPPGDEPASPFAAPEQQVATGTGIGAARTDEAAESRAEDFTSGPDDEHPPQS